MKNSIKAIFFDIDGTFYDHVTNTVIPSTLSAVKALRQEGYKVALCSGRILRLAKELPILFSVPWDGFIASAGHIVYDENLALLQHQWFSDEQLKQIFDIAKERKLTLYADGSEPFMTQKDDRAIAILKDFHVQIPRSIRTYQKQDHIEMLCMFQGYNYDYSCFYQVPDVQLQRSSGYFMDIVKKGVNKYTGIQSLMNYWQLTGSDYMAFGDSMNDVAMLKHAKISVAMQNADPELKKYANYICGPSNSDAIQETLHHFNMIP